MRQPVYDDCMGTDTSHEPSQEGINRKVDNGVPGDAEITEVSSVFGDSPLDPTKHQEEVEVDDARAKVVSLYTEPEVPISPIEDVQRAAENKAELEFGIQNIIEPYVGVFSNKIPLYPVSCVIGMAENMVSLSLSNG
jgi:hypothetical protein